jgi:hypothetical protein
MDGWLVMVAPLELLVRFGAPLGAVVGLRWLWCHARSAGFGRAGRVPDDEVVAEYLSVLDAGWPADAPGTYAEVAVRLGTNIPHVRAVIGRDER